MKTGADVVIVTAVFYFLIDQGWLLWAAPLRPIAGCVSLLVMEYWTQLEY